MDKEARIFVIAVDKAYPARLAFLAVEDFRAEVRGVVNVVVSVWVRSLSLCVYIHACALDWCWYVG